MRTHQVANQPPVLTGYDAYAVDAVLREAVHREGGGAGAQALHELGRLAGSAEAIEWGVQADRNPPVLRSHDRFGHRLDEVDYHPAYHRLLAEAVRAGLHAAPWLQAGPGAHVTRAAAFLLWSQVDAGVGCPASMSYASVAALRAQPELLDSWLPALATREYDPGLRPITGKRGALTGMTMTEKQGGSDLRAKTTIATPAGPDQGPGAEYLLTGHKWFCSAPMSDGFLVLAQAPGGLTCFLLPRVLPDGTRNELRLQRLKDKLGNRSNASAEIELEDAHAWLVGEPGSGVRTIVEMVALTRLDCVLGTAALIRQAVLQAIHHAEHRSAFGRVLVDQPLMQAVLADLAVESEAATALGIRLAAAVDRSERPGADPTERLLRRVATAAGKYWVCKRGPVVVAEALECLGGNGYVEDSGLPRLYREAPLNSIWEGSGNVNALDVLRALHRQPETGQALLAEVEQAAGADRRLDAQVAALRHDLASLHERTARRLVERMALVLQGSLLVRHAPAAVADAFCATRLAGDWGHTLGTLPDGVDAAAIVARHSPSAG